MSVSAQNLVVHSLGTCSAEMAVKCEAYTKIFAATNKRPRGEMESQEYNDQPARWVSLVLEPLSYPIPSRTPKKKTLYWHAMGSKRTVAMSLRRRTHIVSRRYVRQLNSLFVLVVESHSKCAINTQLQNVTFTPALADNTLRDKAVQSSLGDTLKSNQLTSLLFPHTSTHRHPHQNPSVSLET